MPHATTADGTPVWYDVRGTGRPGAPPVVLLPGQSLDHHMWDGLWERLAARRRVVLLDPRGTGRSRSLGPTPLTTALLADDVRDVLCHVAGERAHLVGFSMGGRVGQTFAVRHPGLLASLVLVATGPGRGHEVPRPRAATQALLGASTDAGRAAMTDLFYTPGFVAAHPEQPARTLAAVAPDVVRAHFVASRGHGVWDDLPGISAPTLVVHGDDDELTPVANARLLAQRIPGARLHTGPGRHGSVVEHADTVLPVVQAFLDEVDGADGGRVADGADA